MKKLDASMNTPGRMTVLAVLLAGLAQTGFASAAVAVPVAAPNHLVISQVYGGGGNNGGVYYNDFIELFNPTSAAISVEGWTVQYASAGGKNWARTLLTGTVPAGGYYLIQEAKGAAVSGQLNLPAADVVAPSPGVAMAATAGEVILSSQSAVYGTIDKPTENVVDAVSYGSGTVLEGANTGVTANTTGVRRNDSCVDTDNNKNDFSVVTPVARNSATAATVCGTVAPPVFAPIVLVCPATYALGFGTSGSTALTASDADSLVNSAIISSGATAGISLVNFTASSANGGNATVSLSVASTVPAGTYPIGITVGNDGAQTANCTVSVAIQAPAGSVTHTIAQIQGAGLTSPVNNQVVTTEGVVTFMNEGVYSIQSLNPDGDPTTSDGLLIFNTPPAGMLVGDLVRVTGTVTEYKPDANQRSMTEIKTVTAATVQSHGNVIQPTNVSFADIRSGKYDSMLINIVDTLVVQQTESLATFGEVSLAVGRKEVPTSHFRPGSPDAIALRAANDVNELVLTDGLSTAPTAVPYLSADKTLRAGTSITSLTGVLDFGNYSSTTYGQKLNPTVTPVFSDSNPRTASPSLPIGNVKVASANVLNFFTVFLDGTDVTGASGKTCLTGCRGADNLPEFIRQRDKIVNELKGIDADVFGLMEIQNDGDSTVTYLVNQLNAAIGSTTYAVVPKPADTGTDAIRVAMIYKPSKLGLVGGPLSDGNSVNNRPPFAQTFSVANGGKFSLIVNHMKSKGSCSALAAAGDKDSGDGQSCWNLTRVNQATRLTSFFIPQVVAAGGTPNVLVIGDLNSYGMEDPIKVITDTGMVNQLERFVRPIGMPYSFVFDNEAGYLDHALASAALSSQVLGAAEWHNNADEPTAIDYNFDGKPGGTAKAPGIQTDPSKDTYVNNAYRASDHDPVVISLNLVGTSTDVTGSFQTLITGPVFVRASGKYTVKYTFQNTTGSAITGPFKVELGNLTSGVTLDGASGTHNGAPYVSVPNASVAPGETVTLSLTFTNPGKIAFNFAPVIYTGNF